MGQLNVRLRPEDERLVREIRSRGVSLSGIVRRAVREEAARARVVASIPATGVLDEMMALHPTPTRRVRDVSGSDRAAVKQAIRAKLTRRK